MQREEAEKQVPSTFDLTHLKFRLFACTPRLGNLDEETFCRRQFLTISLPFCLLTPFAIPVQNVVLDDDTDDGRSWTTILLSRGSAELQHHSRHILPPQK